MGTEEKTEHTKERDSKQRLHIMEVLITTRRGDSIEDIITEYNETVEALGID